jgi:hypothetical protein
MRFLIQQQIIHKRDAKKTWRMNECAMMEDN